MKFNIYLKENISKNTSYDLDEFISGKYNKLLIMGLPGTGKTTFAHSLEKKYNIPVIHTDDCTHETFRKLKGDSIEPLDFWKKAYKECIEPNMKSGKKLIIEGIIYQWYNLLPSARPLIIQFPSIVLSKVFKKRPPGKRNMEIEGKSVKDMLNFYIKDKQRVSKSTQEYKGDK
jgi:adenylate kinase family enzyme